MGIHKPNNSSSKSAMNGEQNKTKNKKNKKENKQQSQQKKVDEMISAYTASPATPQTNNALDVSSNILDKQEDIFEQHPDEYFNEHNIGTLMQNKLKLEVNHHVPGISIWRDKKELEPLLNNNDFKKK